MPEIRNYARDTASRDMRSETDFGVVAKSEHSLEAFAFRRRREK